MKKAFLVTLLLALLALSAAIYGKRYLILEAMEVTPPKIEKLEISRARQVYPFSVVPGGVYNSREVADSTRRDAVVREHYEGIDIERLHPARLSEPIFAYVSYRKGNVVAWTDHQVEVPAQEVVLTDGTNLVRARCGNRIVIQKPEPLPARMDPADPPPPDLVFESPLPGLAPSVVTLPPPPRAEIAETRIPVEPPPNWQPPLVPCCDTPPPGPVPEPGTLALMGIGVAALGRKLWKNKTPR